MAAGAGQTAVAVAAGAGEAAVAAVEADPVPSGLFDFRCEREVRLQAAATRLTWRPAEVHETI
jgi:hypothetical protein